jgi:sterol desaturase/sphingolipid hydroxylase (fatty acid hydroxylase superfamily)
MSLVPAHNSVDFGSHRADHPRSTVRTVLTVLLGLGVLALCISDIRSSDVLHNAWLRRTTGSAWDSWRATVLDPFYWGFLVVLSALQWIWPSQAHQRHPSRALAEDATWFFLSTALQVTMVAGFLALLGTAYQDTTGGWSLNLTPLLGVWGVAIVAFVLTDFLAWFTHWAHHHVGTLWYFHAVHHSQENLNVLSDNRQHVVETMASAAMTFLPGMLLGLNAPDALKLAFSGIYISAFIHTNIRTNLGVLRYVFVSPQVHRVHHSIYPEYFNTNYGTAFIFWDLLFGTRHPDHNVYPPTGITDPNFPRATGSSPRALVDLWVRQTIYPFRLLFTRNTGYAGNRATRGSAAAS